MKTLAKSLLDTGDKSFRCDDCGKSFGRSDLLKRHARLHTPEASAERGEKEAANRGTRVSQACANCATAKIKCTQEKPCKRCNAHQLVCEPNFRTHTREDSSPSPVTLSSAPPPRPASPNTSPSAEDAPCNYNAASGDPATRSSENPDVVRGV
ncbi:hypothetical protein BDV39DRAFT_201109 [Aspergillus sergii]|uniref:C2H2-type domain-containing protein n=1 Tax=Aspergillus sergii TaxID=1034303 RepID=A0A5N6XF60_9EURO|nr:hypothetical protein BDV39DRAFT_201109 [Aspergillus sergii]